MEITIEQLEQLLNEQKILCRHHFYKTWLESELVDELKKIDCGDRILNKIHEVRDPIINADYPADFNVLKKYLT